jgi:hypothetical protein
VGILLSLTSGGPESDTESPCGRPASHPTRSHRRAHRAPAARTPPYYRTRFRASGGNSHPKCVGILSPGKTKFTGTSEKLKYLSIKSSLCTPKISAENMALRRLRFLTCAALRFALFFCGFRCGPFHNASSVPFWILAM